MESPPLHHWIDPQTVAQWLDATKHGEAWRAKCPAHQSDNPTTLTIQRGTDRYGQPCTLLHCFVGCGIQAICEALGIPLKALFLTHPDYSKRIQSQPRATRPQYAQRDAPDMPYTTDDLAEMMLCDMIISDPPFIEECDGARETFYRLAQEPARRNRLFQALRQAQIVTHGFWNRLVEEYHHDA